MSLPKVDAALFRHARPIALALARFVPDLVAAADEAAQREARLKYLRSTIGADLVIEMHPLALRLMQDGAIVELEGKRYEFLGAVGDREAVLREVRT